MNIVIGKIITGDFVVGKLETKRDALDKSLIIEYLSGVYGLIIHPDHNNPQKLRSMIIPLMAPFDDKAIKEISFDKLVAPPIPAPEDIERVYIKLTTGIDVVSAGTKIIQ